MITREAIRGAATDVMIRSRISELRQQCADAVQVYSMLIANGTTPEVAAGFFSCSRLLERLAEREDSGATAAAPGASAALPVRWLGGGGTRGRSPSEPHRQAA